MQSSTIVYPFSKKFTQIQNYNLQVLSCNACKMFFRRATLGKSEKFCINNDNCDTSNLILTCRQCRYNKCLKMGMRIVTNQYDSLDDIIKVLAKWNLDRSNKLMNFQCFEDPTLDQVIQKHPVFTKKPSNLSFSKSEWGFMEQLTTVEFMSKFEFTRHLFSEDFRIVLKSSCFKIASFIKAVRSYSMKKEDIRYPDGELIVPMELVPFCTSEFLARVQCRLIGRIIELKLKEEEFLLLIAIFVCDPSKFILTKKSTWSRRVGLCPIT